MNRIVVNATLALLLSGSLAFAQAPASDVQQPTAQPAAPAHTPNPHRQAMNLARKLGLTRDQAAQLQPIFAARDQKLATLRADTSLQPRQARQQLRLIRQSTNQQLSSVLTPDQLQRWKTLRQARAHRSQPNPSAAPAA